MAGCIYDGRLHACSRILARFIILARESLREPVKGPTAVNCADGKMSGPSAQHGAREGSGGRRRHSCSYADGHRRPRSGPRHKRLVTIGTTKPSAQLAARWAQIILPLTVSTCADGQAVGSDAYAMPTARPSAQVFFIYFANLFIVSKYLNLFIYVLLSSIYIWETKV
jgi:hypothetical protein